jgi:uncharacterized protein YciI
MWHLILHTRGPSDETIDEDVRSEHLKWIKSQQLNGKMLFAGPSADGAVGIMVFGHLSESEVEQLCLDDPLIAGRRESFTVIPWDIHQVLGVGGSSQGT